MATPRKNPKRSKFEEWQAEREVMIRHLRDEGLTVVETAEKMGITPNAVRKRLEKMRDNYGAKTNYQLFNMIGDSI